MSQCTIAYRYNKNNTTLLWNFVILITSSGLGYKWLQCLCTNMPVASWTANTNTAVQTVFHFTLTGISATSMKNKSLNSTHRDHLMYAIIVVVKRIYVFANNTSKEEDSISWTTDRMRTTTDKRLNHWTQIHNTVNDTMTPVAGTDGRNSFLPNTHVDKTNG